MLSASIKDFRMIRRFAIVLALATACAQRHLPAEEASGGHAVDVGPQMQS